MSALVASILGGGGVAGAVIGVVAAIAGITALVYSRRQNGISVRDDARDEALQLAEVRRQTIVDLNARVDGFRGEIARMEKRHSEQVATMESQIASLQRNMQQLREESAEAQRTMAVTVRLSLRNMQTYLEAEPPDVNSALRDLRDMLDGQKTT